MDAQSEPGRATSPSFPEGLPPARSEIEVRQARKVYCEDCRFCDAATGMAFARCTNPRATPISNDRYVSRSLDRSYASSMRGMADRCGDQAEWFMAKPVEVAAE